MQYPDAIKLEFVKFGLAFGLLVITWLMGQQVVAYWDFRKKWRELDLLAAERFRQLYGEFKTVHRLWKNVVRGKVASGESRKEARYELLKRAAYAEGEVEALILKVIAEKSLDSQQIATLGLFRQSYQTLREALEDDKTTGGSYKDPDYVLFHRLATEVWQMICPIGESHLVTLLEQRSEEPLAAKRRNLEHVLSFRSEDFDEAVNALDPRGIVTSEVRRRTNRANALPLLRDGV